MKKSAGTERGKMRNSGIELLKILAMMGIVICHVTQTLSIEISYFYANDYVLPLNIATTNGVYFILGLFRYLGMLGNTIFIVCSSWFLLKSSNYDKRKCFFILAEIWFVSVVILAIVLVDRHGEVVSELIKKSLLPTTYSNNWFLTCYLLIYPIHPLLNGIINKLDKRSLFRSSLALFVIYICFCFVENYLFFASKITFWITIYFVTAYFQLYLKNWSDKLRNNIVLMMIGLLGYIGIDLVMNLLGLKVNRFGNDVLKFASNPNPFLLAVSIAAFNLFRKMTFKSRIINYISSISLLVYIIHENILLRGYYRPAIWNYVYHKFGYSHVLLWVLAIAFIIFASSTAVATLYDITLRKVVRNASYGLYSFLKSAYLKLEKKLISYT